MREIKFRAWDTEYKNWIELNLGKNFTGKIDKRMLKEFAKIWNTGAQPQEWSQYTGLKDRNGVEIYESDLYTMPPHDDQSKKYEVKWGHSGFNLPDSQYMQVIGNIYEES